MDGNISDECLNNPQFLQLLSATLTLEISNKEKEIQETNRLLENLKISIASDVKDRKRLKQLIEIEQRKKNVFKATLNVLQSVENEKMLELSLVKEKQDENQLREQIEQERLLKILETYKETWTKYEAEYEQFPLAIERKKHKIEVEKMKIKCMVQEYKKTEYHKMLKQRNEIDNRKMQSVVIKLSEILLKRWDNQKQIDELTLEYKNLKIKWDKISKQHEKMRIELEAEAKNKALARLQMPPPRIDFSFMRAVYTESTSKNQFDYSQRLHKRSDSDSISVNTIMLEEICREEQNDQSFRTEDDREEQNEPISSVTCEDDLNVDTSEKLVDDETTDSNTEMLENVCRQLSIKEQTCEISNNETPTKISSHVDEEMDCDPRETQETFSNKKSNYLKKKAVPIDEVLCHENFEKIEKKKPKLDYSFDSCSQASQKSKKETFLPTKPSVNNNIQFPPNSGPQVRSIEKISQPLAINIKPPMAEVPPTPSALYSPHYGSHYGSSTNLSTMNDTNLDDSDMNWLKMIPSRSGSNVSYASSSFVTKTIPADNNIQKPPNNPPTVNVTDFLNFFSTSNQTNKRIF
ncbi:calponin homology domain-containing protein DDB_G0272472-like [Microplitis mediator]|uniref:calponin homology domain-containing protein DDB_G0272472-like n=1 Tax=Microplitis mediator TaxID=375433 RepID=UPI002552C4A2|nr:calponin homology domain-containing protein DDB_G0272472-like [Microplitis mediator]XP_057331681.1 calponin homology domain-containing protein DDB_G0272472-like [Microplitis mediator]